MNCTSCHISPSGGGVLTQYGRELSREVLSYASREKEAAFLYGAVVPPDWLTLGGDVRVLGFYRDTPTFTQGQVFPMQMDMEAAATYKNFIVVGTMGYQRPSRTSPNLTDYFISRRHYVNYRPTGELSIRAGMFMPAFGINTPDHATVTKRGLGWNAGSETYNLETAWIGERFNLYATAILGRPDALDLNREKGAAVLPSLTISDTYRVGFSYFYGLNTLGNRHVFGPFGILGFTPHFFLLTELDFQSATSQSDPSHPQWGVVNYQKLDYEFFQGFHGYITQELSRLNFASLDSLSKTYGIGLQFFPRPHLELNFSWQIQTSATLAGYTDFGFLLLHFYP